MKRFLLSVSLSVLLALIAAQAPAQHIAYNERTPKINLKKCRWLDGAVPDEKEMVYIGFIYSRSATCLEFCYRIRRQIEQSGLPIRVILVTREPEHMIEQHLHDCTGPHIGTVIDEEGEIFRRFGIRYVPFGVLTDSKRRTVWFGNPLTADKNIFYGLPDKKSSRKNDKKEKRKRNLQ